MKWEDLILIHFQGWSRPAADTLFTYAAMETEVNTDAIVDYMHFQHPGLTVAYPVCDFSNNTMQAFATSVHTSFSKNKYGTPEPDTEGLELISPDSIDFVFVPLLCFDRKGYRVGYGKGFYDKYLSLCRQDVVKVGLSYFDPVEEIEDSDKFDVPLNYCITPERIHEF